jgi:uncharacterized protein
MKFSQFNIWASIGDEFVLFNTLTGALATFESCYQESIQRALVSGTAQEISTEFLDDMIEDGYIVEDDADELNSIRIAREDRRSRTDEFSLCITLNKKCIFGCPYCFQVHDGKKLSEDGKIKIVQMFDAISLRAKKIDMDWFGGEPLLSLNDMKKMNDWFINVSKERGVQYSYSITTNGYLLTDDVIEYLQQEKPSRVVVTLDGPPDVHDLSRPLKKGGKTFWVILGNIKKAVASGLNVTVRVNISSQNVKRIPELFDLLEEQGLKNLVNVDLQAVVSSEANPYEEYCLTGHDLAHSVLSICLIEAKKGWIVFPPIEEVRGLGFCVGEYPNRFIFDLDCNIYRCTQMAEGDSIGRILDGGRIELDQKANAFWVDKDPLSFDECRTCAFLPVCMGGCNMKRFQKDSSQYCVDRKYDIPTFLEVLLLNEENLSLLK